MLGHLVAIQLLAADWIDPQDRPLAISVLAYGSVRTPEPLNPTPVCRQRVILQSRDIVYTLV